MPSKQENETTAQHHIDSIIDGPKVIKCTLDEGCYLVVITPAPSLISVRATAIDEIREKLGMMGYHMSCCW
jgi:hypothetical protein